MNPSNQDGRAFIRASAIELLDTVKEVKDRPPTRRKTGKPISEAQASSAQRQVFVRPRTFQHYVMNLPATAISFLDSFIGLYKGKEHLFAPHTDVERPIVHVYCFAFKNKEMVPDVEICNRISKALDYQIQPGDHELNIAEVRIVAPSKQMFCASFRLPAEVLFR